VAAFFDERGEKGKGSGSQRGTPLWQFVKSSGDEKEKKEGGKKRAPQQRRRRRKGGSTRGPGSQTPFPNGGKKEKKKKGEKTRTCPSPTEGKKGKNARCEQEKLGDESSEE